MNGFLSIEAELSEDEAEEGRSKQSSVFSTTDPNWLIKSTDSVTKNRNGIDEAKLSLMKTFRRKARLQQTLNVRSGSLFQGQQLSALQNVLKSELAEMDLEERTNGLIEKKIFHSSQQLCQLAREVREYDNLISLAAKSISLNNNPLRSTDNNNNNNASDSIAGVHPSVRKELSIIMGEIRMNPLILGMSLLRCNYLTNNDDDNNASYNKCYETSQRIVVSIFNSCFTSYDEGLLLHFIEGLCMICPPVISSSTSYSNNQDSFIILFLITYLQYTYLRTMISDVMKDNILEVIQDLDLDLSSNHRVDEKRMNEARKQLNTISFRFINAILDNVNSVPYGLRYITRVISQLEGKDARSSVIFIVMENIFIRSLIKPELYGITLLMHPLSKNNLLCIARNITYIINNVNNNMNDNNIHMNDNNMHMNDNIWSEEYCLIQEKIEEYCMECIRVPTLDDYYGYKIHTGIIASNIYVPRQESILLSSCDLYHILTIINTNRHIDNSNRPLYNLIDNNINKLSKEHNFIILNLNVSSNGNHNITGGDRVDNDNNDNNGKNDDEIEKSKEECKILLKNTLISLDTICGYSDHSIITILLHQSSRMRMTSDNNSIKLQLNEVIRRMKRLPQEYSWDDYSRILSSLSNEYCSRKRMKIEEKKRALSLLNRLQYNIHSVSD